MNKETNTLIPEIRFPEFLNDGKWEENTFEELFKIGNGKDYKHLGKGEIPVYGSGGYMLSVNDYLYDGESVCIGRKGTIDKPMFLKGKFWTVDTLFYSHSFKNCLPKYIHYVFQNINWLKHNEAGGVPSLSKTNIYKIKTLVPQPNEQQKIASCLSSLDDLIAAHSQKLDFLKEHKKGLMQNLFPQEGETVPKYRFPEFVNDGEWVEKTFEELFVIGNGRDYKHLDKGKIPVYGSGGHMLFVNDYLYDGESTCIGRKGTIDKPMFLSGKFWTVDTLFYTHSFKKCLPKFIYYVFQNINWLNHNEAGGIPSLSKTNIYKIKTYLPKPKEQKYLVDCISSLDNLITTQEEKIEQLKLHKKGLMQGLFPKIND
ncbi:restriction endonuclease subunit S [Flavobacterium frigidarium]|jgi:type I restriction enzyme S subunit|uniref:Restriction endonuclease subunit S n=1 Tax=Flavobacterium frigidarium TaxID=99286 RepID=A0ABV4KEK3_9FLAO